MKHINMKHINCDVAIANDFSQNRLVYKLAEFASLHGFDVIIDYVRGSLARCTVNDAYATEEKKKRYELVCNLFKEYVEGERNQNG